jgi:antirestriction protein ArdC
MSDSTTWSDLLNEAITKPGLLSKAYSFFHNYSIGNQLLAIVQCTRRGIEPGPIATYPTWLERGRQVRKGEKAMMLCMPITCKDKSSDDGASYTRFIYKNRWFVLAQTDGEPIEPEAAPDWSRELALQNLSITEIPFDHLDGNCQGFARKRSIAVSPLAVMPHKTTFHELAHVQLGHTAEADFADTETTPRSLREVEAECVALILCDTLGLSGAEYSRGYIQDWLGERNTIPTESAQKIFKAADSILKAGQPRKELDH